MTFDRTDWPAELDAIVAAPQYHAVSLENDAVRVLDTSVPPGHTVPLHTHRWPAVHTILSWSDFVRRDAAGAILADSRSLPRPAQGSVAVSVVAPRTIDSEAWAKPYFVNGRQWAARHKPKEFRVFFCEDRTDQPCAWLQ